MITSGTARRHYARLSTSPKGEVIGQCYRRHPNTVFRMCLDHIQLHRIVRSQIHIVLDNHSNYQDGCTSEPLEPPPSGRLTRTPNGEEPK